MFRTVNTTLMESTVRCACQDFMVTLPEEHHSIARLMSHNEKKKADHVVTAVAVKNSPLSQSDHKKMRADHVVTAVAVKNSPLSQSDQKKMRADHVDMKVKKLNPVTSYSNESK